MNTHFEGNLNFRRLSTSTAQNHRWVIFFILHTRNREWKIQLERAKDFDIAKTIWCLQLLFMSHSTHSACDCRSICVMSVCADFKCRTCSHKNSSYYFRHTRSNLQFWCLINVWFFLFSTIICCNEQLTRTIFSYKSFMGNCFTHTKWLEVYRIIRSIQLDSPFSALIFFILAWNVLLNMNYAFELNWLFNSIDENRIFIIFHSYSYRKLFSIGGKKSERFSKSFERIIHTMFTSLLRLMRVEFIPMRNSRKFLVLCPYEYINLPQR